MQTSISKRLLAGLLSIVMVLSLFVATPAKTEAASRETLTIELNGGTGIGAGDVVYTLFGAVAPADITFEGGTACTALALANVTVNNGSYDLDLDSEIYFGDEVTFTFRITDAEQLEHLKTVQAHVLGGTNEYNRTGYEICDFTVTGKYLIVKCHVPKENAVVDKYDVASINTVLKYQYYFSGVSVEGPNTGKRYTLGAMTWLYTTDNGAHFSPAPFTYPALGSCPDANCYYAVETVISAMPGFELMWAAGTTETFANPRNPRDTRTFTITDVSADKKSAVLRISKIVPRLTADFVDTGITSIELNRAANFGTNDVVLAADVAKKIPNTIVVTVAGEKKTIDVSSYIAKGWFKWQVCAMSGSSLVPMDDKDPITGTQTWEALAPEYNYYAVLVATATYPNTYNVPGANAGQVALNSVLFYNSLADSYGLLDIYYDEIATEFGLDDDYGWVVQFTRNDARDFGNGQKTPVEAYTTVAAPTISFYGYGTAYKAYAFGQGTTAFEIYEVEYDEAAGAWVRTGHDDTQTTYDCPTTHGAVYVATVAGTKGFVVESPMVLTYFDVNANNVAEITTGVISVQMDVPYAGRPIYYNINNVEATLQLASAIDADYAELDWDGAFAYNRAGMYYYFYYGYDATAYVYVPLKAGYKLGFTPEVRINGEKATAVSVEEIGDTTYVIAEMTWGTDGIETICSLNGTTMVLKQPWTNINIPYAGAKVQKTLEVSGESKDYGYDFVNVAWYENAVEFTGDTFTLGKRYTAVVTLSIDSINVDCNDITELQGNLQFFATVPGGMLYPQGAAIKNAKASVKDGEVVITFEFGECKNIAITDIEDVTIVVPNGMDKDAFYAYVAKHMYTTVHTSTGDAVTVDLGLTFSNGGDATDVNDVAAVFALKYPGALGYDPYSTTAQTFEFDGYYNAPVNTLRIIIKVEGKKHNMIFDANGGVYTGKGCSIEEGKPYGFGYDPSEIYREGYFFAGWFTQATGGTRIYAKTIADGKVTKVYAHWVKVFTGKVWTLTANSYAAGRLTVKVTKIATKWDGFEFSVSKDGSTWTTVNKTGDTAYFTGLTKGAYKVRVRAYRRDSAGKLVYGAYSAVSTATVK